MRKFERSRTPFTHRTYTVDALGNWQQQVTEERVADQVRIERNTSNATAGESVSIYHGGLMVEQRRPSDTVSTRMVYDSLARLISTKQPHHAHADAILYAVGGNQVVSRTDANGATTSYGYFPQGSAGAGRVASTTYADLTVQRSAYDLRGNMIREWGSGTAPIGYTYDAYNQMETLSTYRTAIISDSAAWPTTIGTPDVTTWIREDSTGLLLQKKYAGNLGPVYEYDIAGRVSRRTSARGLITDYTYTAWGQPDVTNYRDTTPDTDTDYDRMGRKTRESNGVATSDFQYSPTTLRQTLETISYDLDRNGTPELMRQLDRSHDNLRRPTGFTLKDGTTLENQAIYGYDAYSRLGSVERTGASPASFTYSYIQNSSLLYQVIGPAHTVTNTWEPDRDVLDVKENKAGNTIISRLDYTVNAIGQRTVLSQTGTAFASVRGIAWGYDNYGQVTTADSTVTGQDRAYQYDAIGNRKKSVDSLVLPSSDNYTANALNQYTSVPSAASVPSYDADGNATAFPLPVAPTTNSTLVWDAENRMISSTVSGITTSQKFDTMGRRISKTTGTSSIIYLYDRWNCIAEYTKSDPAVSAVLSTTNLWGTDLSGSLQGAGGVGGLLSVTNGNATHFPTYDGNGNVSEYLTIGGAVAAHLEYDPFGNAVVNTDVAGLFTYKFSTKPQDVETGLYYYGYRFYDSSTGRWPSRDLIGERGGVNLYGFVGNNSIDRRDRLGLSFWGWLKGNEGWVPGDQSGFMDGLDKPVGGLSSTPQGDIFDAVDLGMKFVNGTDSPLDSYGPNSAMTDAIRTGYLGAIVRSRIREFGRDYCGGNKVSLPFSLSLGSELKAIPEWKYPLKFGVWLVTNPMTAFTGSFTDGNITVNSVDCSKCTAMATVNAINRSGGASATRLPGLFGGYDNFGPFISDEGWNFPFSTVLPNDLNGPNAPLNTIQQNYTWNESVNFSK